MNRSWVCLLAAENTELRRVAFAGTCPPEPPHGPVVPAAGSPNSCHAWVALGSSSATGPPSLFPDRPSSSSSEKPNSTLHVFMASSNPFVPVPALFFGPCCSPSPLFALPMYLQSATSPSELSFSNLNKPRFPNSDSVASTE